MIKAIYMGLAATVISMGIGSIFDFGLPYTSILSLILALIFIGYGG